MPKRIAIEMTCDRCKAVWMEDYTPGDPEPETASVTLMFKTPLSDALGVFAEREVSYDVLCPRCTATVSNYIEGVELDPDARRKPRAKKEGGEAETPPPPAMPPAGAEPGASSGDGASGQPRRARREDSDRPS